MKRKLELGTIHRGWRGVAGAVTLVALSGGSSVAVAQDFPAGRDFHPIDLAHLCTASSNAPAPKSWIALPRGRQTFGGVPFKIDCPLEVTGMDDASHGEFHPIRLPWVAVGRKASQLHLLHGTVRDDKDGVPLANLIFHYVNGEQRTIRLAYGIHARNWVKEPTETRSELIDPGSRQVWTTGTDDADRPGASLRLFHSALANPLPEVELKHLEVVSMFSRATPFIAAVTTETGSSVPSGQPSIAARRVVKKSMELEDTIYHDQFVIRATDPVTGRPLTNAHAVLTISNDETAFYFGRAQADATGTIHLPFPPQQTVAFTALVRAPGRVPFTFGGTKTNGGDFARHLEAKLTPGVKIGGIVSQPGGKPVAGAEVVVYKLNRDGPRDYTRIDHETVRTDPQGRWSSEAVPADFSGFSFQVTHPDHRSTTVAQATASGSPAGVNPVSRDDLLAGKALFELPPALRIEGVVMDDTGKAVGNAELHLVDAARMETTRVWKCDGKGRFSFALPEAGEFSVMIRADGYRPKFQTLPVGPEIQSLTFAVAKASPFRGRVIDQGQQPVAGARVKLDTWNGTRVLQWQTLTDAQGRFVWDSPVEGNVMFHVTATNHSSSRMSFSTPSGESTIRLRKLSRVIGRVVDAETGKPIDEFTIIRGRTYNYDEPMRWDRYDSTRGRRGEYVSRLEDYSSGSGGSSQIMVEAPGYLPAASVVFIKPGLYTNDFALKRGRGISGVVQLPDGTPVANATVALVERSDSAYMERPGELRRSSGGEFQRSNLRGQFEFPAKLEPHAIFAAHEQGFAEVRASNVVATGKVVLQPWGRVKGVLRVSHLPEQSYSVSLQSGTWRYGEEGRNGAPLSLQLKAVPDTNGAFMFDKVPVGERRVFLQFKLNDRENGRVASSHGTPVTVKPNETAEVIVGGQGRTVIGRVNVIGGDVGDIDWRRDVHTFQSQVTLPADINPPMFTPNMSEEDRRKAQQEYNARQTAFWRTEKGRAMERAQRSYTPLFETNGTFRIGNVVPGDYSLYVSVTNPDRPDNYYEQIGWGNKQVQVPPAPAGQPDEPFDIGALDLQIRGTLRTGRRAPPFEVKTFDGKTVKLEDFKGKYVLLDFWATWAGTRTPDLQVLKALHEAYARDNRLVMIGLNFDHESKTAVTAIAQGGMKWTQCYPGGWGQTPLPNTYGIQGLPEVVLIDPEGKIVAANLRGSNIRNTVRNHLSTPRATGAKPAP